MVTPTTLVLEKRLRLADVTTLHATLLSLLRTGAPVCIDGSQVEEIDSASLQLLASLWRSATTRECECSWAGVSEPLRRAACLTGVTETLAMPAAPL